MPRFQVQVNRCKICEKAVYPMEELIADNNHYHKPCFRCNKCNRTLSTGSYASLEGAIFCKPHFLQLFKQKGNYEEGFGKERYKNKWNGPNSKTEVLPNGQICVVKESPAQSDSEEKENMSSTVSHEMRPISNGNHVLDKPSNQHVEDSTDGVEEERTPISLEYKKSKLFQNTSNEPQVKQPTPGKLNKWEPVSSRQVEPTAAKPAPKKLTVDWSAKTQERAGEKAEEDQPIWVKIARQRATNGVRFAEVGSVKNKFESGEVGKKEFKSDVRTEVDIVAQSKSGTAQSTKSKYENRQEKQYDNTKKKELEELKIARALAARQKNTANEEGEYLDRRVVDEYDRYQELEEFKKAAAAKQNLTKFESGEFSNLEESEIEARKEVEEIAGSGKATTALKIYETGEFEKKEYISPVKQELVSIKADTSTKKSLYESGRVEKEYDSEAKRELESITTAAGETRDKFESGVLLNTTVSSEDKANELEQIRSVSAAGEKKNKFESGELLRTEFSSDVRKEIETIKTAASDVKSKYESGELIRKDFASDAKKEVESMSTGAMDKKNKYETGDFDQQDYSDSQARREAEELQRLKASSNVKSKYQEAVIEGNKIITSKPVTIEKAPPNENPFPSRDEDEDFKITDDTEVGNCDETQFENDIKTDSDNDDEYVPLPEPKRMTDIEERFKKPEVVKEAPAVNKIQIPTFENFDSDEEVNGSVPNDEELAKLKEQMWPQKTANIKGMFETKANEDDGPKETPKPIDLEAEINAYTEHVKKNRPKKHKTHRKGSSASETSVSNENTKQANRVN